MIPSSMVMVPMVLDGVMVMVMVFRLTVDPLIMAIVGNTGNGGTVA